MISEIELNSIINNNTGVIKVNEIKVKNVKVLNGVLNEVLNRVPKILNRVFNKVPKSKLKHKIKNIYNKFDIPLESFYISLYSMFKYIKLSNVNIPQNKIYDYLICNIIIANKQLLDDFNPKNFCKMINYDFDTFLKFEIDILNTLNWNIEFNSNEYNLFKSNCINSKNF